MLLIFGVNIEVTAVSLLEARWNYQTNSTTVFLAYLTLDVEDHKLNICYRMEPVNHITLKNKGIYLLFINKS